MILFEHFENAYRTLRRNRARTILTTLGIAIGIGSVVSILALSDGVTSIIEHQVDDLGGNLMIVRPGLISKDPNRLTSPVSQQSFTTSSLTELDTDTIAKLPGVQAAAPIMTIDGSLRAGSTVVNDATVVATTPVLADITKLPIRDGQFIDDSTDRDTAVIGAQLAVDLFGTDRPIGQSFTLRGQQFTVIGILKHIDNPINYNNVDYNHAVFVSFESGKSFHQGRSQIQQIDIRATSTDKLPALTKAIHDQLVQNHLGEEDFSVISGKAIGQPASQLFRAMTDVMAAIAAISLFVGGIGIMNIMLVGVAERTREIGIRKAVGASNSMITVQFLIESLLISLLGGILGYLIGYAVACAFSAFLFFSPSFTWLTAIVALAMAVFTGLVFGLYPALRASRKDTIESLRQYH